MSDSYGTNSSSTVSPAWYKSGQKIVTNVISIQETKEAMDKTEELLKKFLEQVHANEPGCELFMLNRDDERFQFVTYEIYKDAEAVKIHLRSTYMRELIEAEDAHNVKRGGNDIHHETLVAQIGPRH